jgi:hypothetical protein
MVFLVLWFLRAALLSLSAGEAISCNTTTINNCVMEERLLGL